MKEWAFWVLVIGLFALIGTAYMTLRNILFVLNVGCLE
jgi:hypothetical protein